MCGIVGFVGGGDGDDLARMMRAIAHRGPDEQGDYTDPESGIHLGHVRLSIIDLEGGAQPMWDPSGTVAVSFNGEIYNHLDLRRELEQKGHRFKSDHSDTEVLVHGWKEWGEDLPRRLNGMFGFAILDLSQRIVFLARDRFGEKPLYWAQQQGTFYFASELSGIAAHRGFRAEYDRLSIKKYFAHGYIPSPNALYRNSFKLPPAHWLKFDIASGRVQKNAYWKFRMEPTASPPSFDEAAEEIRSLFCASVARRLMSDVPLGVFLSGGIDSSLAAAAMSRCRPPSEVHSFAIGFREKSFDESRYARAVAQALGTRHHEAILDLEGARKMIDDVLGRLDEPLADASLLPTHLLCRFAREKVKVALSGDGGDELFAGYDPFSALKPASLYHKIMPGIIHKGMRSLAELLPKSAANMSFDFKLRRFLQGLDHGPAIWNPAWMAPLENGDIAEIFQEPVEVDELYSEILALWHEEPDKGIIDKTLEFYSNFYLPDDILTKVDRASMLDGLETRSVFLDNDLVDFTCRLPADYKFNGKMRKRVLKRAARGLVPDEVLNRPKKGFGVPLLPWLREMNLTADHASGLSIDGSEISARIAAHQSGKRDDRLFLWAWSVLQHHNNGEAMKVS